MGPQTPEEDQGIDSTLLSNPDRTQTVSLGTYSLGVFSRTPNPIPSRPQGVPLVRAPLSYCPSMDKWGVLRSLCSPTFPFPNPKSRTPKVSHSVSVWSRYTLRDELEFRRMCFFLSIEKFSHGVKTTGTIRRHHSVLRLQSHCFESSSTWVLDRVPLSHPGVRSFWFLSPIVCQSSWVRKEILESWRDPLVRSDTRS